MHVIQARSAHDGLRQGLEHLYMRGVDRDSRNGKVRVSPVPVTTIFENPRRSLVFWDKRDTNIAFLIYEALWMLEGRRDVAPLTKYVKRMSLYAEKDGRLHGAYGNRWRAHFLKDQLSIAIERLKSNLNDRRTVLGMWDPSADLRGLEDQQPGDLPCNMIVTFQVNQSGLLDMTVFNRSNDIIWGTYFANAFHFGMLHDYIAGRVGVSLGRYYQVSVNYHAYHDTYNPLITATMPNDPYPYPGIIDPADFWRANNFEPNKTDEEIEDLVHYADQDEMGKFEPRSDWSRVAGEVLYAHQLHREGETNRAINLIQSKNRHHHWTVAMHHWLSRRVKED